MDSAPAGRGARVTVTKDGPYAVVGAIPLSRQAIGANGKGDSVDWTPGESLTVGRSYMLCRCGRSANKPFCDGTHAKIGFVGDDTATREPYAAQAETFEGPAMALTDAQPLCAFARFCDRDGDVWNNVTTARSQDATETFARQVGQCPSGRLVAWDLSPRAPTEPDLPPSLVLVEDPSKGVSGPIWLRGGVEVVGSDGTAYEVRNRVTLCRCGQSKNKPFCDGAHASVGFKDA